MALLDEAVRLFPAGAIARRDFAHPLENAISSRRTPFPAVRRKPDDVQEIIFRNALVTMPVQSL
ncbi:hypothetical protein [Caballeronia sp. KNU42]